MNILSIDIDVLFRCVEYQSWQDEELTPMQSWQVIKWKSEAKGFTDKLFEPDFKTVEFLKKVLEKKCKNSQPYIIQEHDEIYGILESLPTRNNHVTNIDNHHDLGYQGEEQELDISNWVKYARRDGLLLDYLWVGRDDSELPAFNMFNYIRSSWKDVNVDSLPDYDVVVFCVSKHYTPPRYWNVAEMLRDYLVEEVQLSMVECKEPKYNPSDFPEFEGEDFVDEDDIVVKWWRHKGFYVNGELVRGVLWLSIINVDGRKLNILPVLSKHLKKLVQDYKVVGFCWDDGYKSEKLIKRLAKPYQIVDSYKLENKNHLILKED